jgi:hypothetical protein
MKQLPPPEALRQSPFLGFPDLVVVLGFLALLAMIAHVGPEAMVNFSPPEDSPTISLDPHNLPEYALRSTTRMFIALGAAMLFSLVYGSIAAHHRRAERVMVPLLDILQRDWFLCGQGRGEPRSCRHRLGHLDHGGNHPVGGSTLLAPACRLVRQVSDGTK